MMAHGWRGGTRLKTNLDPVYTKHKKTGERLVVSFREYKLGRDMRVLFRCRNVIQRPGGPSQEYINL